MTLVGPPPLPSANPVARIYQDLRAQHHVGKRFPPGPQNFDLPRTLRMVRDPVPVLLDAYERFGPVFTLKIFYGKLVFALGPEANHTILVSKADHFGYRESQYANLWPLLGDGLLIIDGSFHRKSRQIMLPMFHRDRIAGALALMDAEIERAVRPLRDGDRLDLSAWARELALRVAMRALFGLDPDQVRDIDTAAEFERALDIFSKDYLLQAARGPGTPWARMISARDRLDALIFGEIQRRRRTGERGDDLLSLLLDAQDEDGSQLSDQHVRDEVMTLLFAGHDTSTATVAFMTYELARAPHERALLREEISALGGAKPTYDTLMRDGLPRMDMVLDETLRLWPVAWIGPRMCLKDAEVAGVTVPAGAMTNYCSWASHRLPDVWERPNDFVPDRFSPERKALIPKGAYVPFGGGSRTCIGMRFGQMEIKAIMARVLRDFDLDLDPGWKLRVSQTPTIGPRSHMPVTVRAVS